MYRRRLYKPNQADAFDISRSKIDLFKDCSACFWLDRVKGIGRPRFPGFLINQAIDQTLKTEFDYYRQKQTTPPWVADFGINLIPFDHPDIDTWRHPFSGIRYHHQPTNLTVFGGIDDVWIDKQTNQLSVVDYKATAKTDPITDLDPPGGWHDSYRRQIEIYQWILAQNKHPVSPTGYFVYANGRLDQDRFLTRPYKNRLGRLGFAVTVFAYEGGGFAWVSDCLSQIKKCLDGPRMPDRKPGCEYCRYAKARVALFASNRSGLTDD